MGDKIYVASVVYNLAGDINNRPDYLKTTVIGAVIGEKESIADTITNSYLSGPGLRLRNFARWSRTQGYTQKIGLVGGTIPTEHSIDETVLAQEIPHDPALEVEFQSTLIDDADYMYWADRYVADNKPAQWGTEYVAGINNTTKLITITYVDGTVDTFTPVDFDPYGSYLYAVYTLSGGSPKVFIYKKDSGKPALDAMWAFSSYFGTFFPFIPFRIDNKSVPDLYPDTIYPASEKALKKAFGLSANYDDINKKILENESINDIDYAYIVFGACLNTKENASKKYIYKFFDTILKNTPDAKSINVASSSNQVLNYNMTISWAAIREETGSGLVKPEAKHDELWIESNFKADLPDDIFGDALGMQSVLTITWQETLNSWKRLVITGLLHKNQVYRGNAVRIWSCSAMNDADESGFIIPLHEDIFKSMSIKDYTQMSTACCYIVFNCYKIVKKRWWQTWWFQIIIVVGVIVISIFTFGAGSVGAQAGLLGTNSTVGAAITGAVAGSFIAVLVGAIVNAIVAMIVVMLLSKISTLVFGDKLGAIIGAIVSMVAVAVGSSMMNGKSLSAAFSGMMSAHNLIALSNAVGGGVAGYIAGSTAEIVRDTIQYQKQNEAELKSIEDKYISEFGYGQAIIDPLQFTDNITQSTGPITKNFAMIEPLSLFLNRTLMTGSDIADLSISMIHNFTKLTLNTDLLLSS